MSRAACTFRQADLTRALRASKAADVKVKIKITGDGMEVIPIGDHDAKAVGASGNASALDAWRAGRDDQG